MLKLLVKKIKTKNFMSFSKSLQKVDDLIKEIEITTKPIKVEQQKQKKEKKEKQPQPKKSEQSDDPKIIFSKTRIQVISSSFF